MLMLHNGAEAALKKKKKNEGTNWMAMACSRRHAAASSAKKYVCIVLHDVCCGMNHQKINLCAVAVTTMI
jgi:hypothetical protein